MAEELVENAKSVLAAGADGEATAFLYRALGVYVEDLGDRRWGETAQHGPDRHATVPGVPSRVQGRRKLLGQG